MDANRTPEKRAKLRTVDEINDEMRRNYRLSVNKKITLNEAKNRNASLALLRNGMSDPVDPAQYTPPDINVLSVPSSYFLSLEQIQSVKKGVPIIDIAQCATVEFEPTVPMTDDDNVVPLRLAAPAPVPQSSEEEAQTIAGLKAQINELAEKLGIDLVV